jgi:hypothetical protein
MLRRNLLALVCLGLAGLSASTFGQTAGTHLARFVPGKWMGQTAKVGFELQSVKDGRVTGTFLDITGVNYPIGETWIPNKAASGRSVAGGRRSFLIYPRGSEPI